MALTFYHVDWCPECAVVRDKLNELGVEYDDVVVPDVRPMRKQVYEVSGQYFVPVLKDGETVLTETSTILDHLDRHHGAAGKKQEAKEDGDEFPSCSL